MKYARRIFLALVTVYVLALAIPWFWYAPSRVDRRLASKLTIGMPASNVARIVGSSGPMDTRAWAYCAPRSEELVTRSIFHTFGGVWIFPLPVTVPTSTDFCFDTMDRLIG